MTNMITHCEALDERLADYLEGTLDAEARAALDAHAASCVRCTALLADLEAIRRDARTLPALAPSRDLWEGIAARIEAPVITLESARTRLAARSPLSARWLAAIAAALVVTTAGATYLATARLVAARQVPAVRTVAQTAPRPPAGAAAPVGAPADSAAAATVRMPTQVVSASAAPPAAARREPRGPSVRAVSNRSEMTAYDREIARLRAIVNQRRAELDPATVAIIEQNLQVIDRAIAQSRAALAKDPGSSFLHDQLDGVLNKKVEILRTAALLPARS
jgi:hypothetical protein